MLENDAKNYNISKYNFTIVTSSPLWISIMVQCWPYNCRVFSLKPKEKNVGSYLYYNFFFLLNSQVVYFLNSEKSPFMIVYCLRFIHRYLSSHHKIYIFIKYNIYDFGGINTTDLNLILFWKSFTNHVRYSNIRINLLVYNCLWNTTTWKLILYHYIHYWKKKIVIHFFLYGILNFYCTNQFKRD